MGRVLKITRDKSVLAMLVKYYIAIDGDTKGWIKNGDSVSIDISKTKITEFYVWADFKGLSGKAERVTSQVVRIPNDGLSYHYHIQTKMGLVVGKLELYQDPEQEDKNIKLKQNQFEKANIYRKVEPLISAEVKNKSNGDRNFDKALSKLTDNERKHPVAQNLIKDLYNSLIEGAARFYYDPTRFIALIEDASTIKEYKNDVYVILRNKDVIADKYNRMKSIFTVEEDFPQQLEKLKKKYFNEFSSYTIPDNIINKYTEKAAEASQAYLDKNYKKALVSMMFGDGPFDDFNRLKELYVYQAINSSNNKDDIINERGLQIAYDTFVAPIIYSKDSEEYDYGPTVDTIITKTIVYSKAGIIDNVKNELIQLLDILVGAEDGKFNYQAALETSQFELLRKVFEYYKAYNLEITVLESMYEHNIPRTEKQEKRLAFLKKGNKDLLDIEENNDSSVFVYDYRSLQWKESEIRDYFENYTLNSKKIKIPMVFNSFEKNLFINKFVWDNEKIYLEIKRTINENLGNEYSIELIDTRTIIGDSNNVLPAILVHSSNNITYPWLGFLIIGDQMLLKQVSISIYSLYIPVIISDSEIDNNKYNEKEFLIAKEKQNPRLNNFINMVTNLLIESIETWINNSNSNNDLYD